MPMPVQAWQVWNEPNLKKYFDPGIRPGMGSRSTPSW